MSKLLVPAWLRMLRKTVFWVLLICMFAYGLYSGANIASGAGESFALDACVFDFAPFMGLAAAVLASMSIGPEYSDGAMRNKLIAGHSRARIYLANLIVCSIACLLAAGAYLAGYAVFGCAKGGELLTETSVVAVCMICGVLISLAFTSIMVMLAMLNTNKAGNVVVSMVLALALLLSGSIIHQRLCEPEMEDTYMLFTVDGIPQEVEKTPNPRYVDGKPRAVLQFADDLLPSGQAMQLMYLFEGDGVVSGDEETAPYRWAACSLLVIALTTGAGLALFRKKEIR